MPEIQTLNLLGALDQFEQGREQTQQRRARNALSEFGLDAFQGDRDALSQLFQANPEAGIQLGQIAKANALREDQLRTQQEDSAFRRKRAGAQDARAQDALNLKKQERAERLAAIKAQKKANRIAKAAIFADTPEKWKALVEKEGPEFAAEFGDFGTRQQVISEALSAEDLIKQEIEKRRDPEKNPTVREKERIKNEEKQRVADATRLEGARDFKGKVSRIRELIQKGGNDLFGPVQGSSIGQTVGKVFGTEAQSMREQLQALLSDIELDIAKVKLKGQGQVTEAERKIARDTIPKLTNQDAVTALQILKQLEFESDQIINRQQGNETEDFQTSPTGRKFRIAQ